MPYLSWLLYSSECKQYIRELWTTFYIYPNRSPSIIDINGANRQGSYRFPYYSGEIKTTDVVTIVCYYMQT